MKMDFNAILEADLQPPPDLSSAPTDPSLRRIATAAQALFVADQRLKRAEALVEAIKRRRTDLSTKVLPELMDTAQTDSLGLSGANADVIVETMYHAVIRADWPEAQRQSAFEHLDELGGGDLIKSIIAIQLPRDAYDQAVELLIAIKLWLKHKKLDAVPTLRLDVPWASLTAFVRDWMERPIDAHASVGGAPTLNLTRLGATVMRVCRVVMRKAPKQTRGRRR
jgi:hypothetical protein